MTTHKENGLILKSVEERLASLETSSEHSREERQRIRTEIQTVRAELKSVDHKQDEILKEFHTIKGKFGGVVLTISAIVTFLSMFGEKIYRFFTGGN